MKKLIVMFTIAIMFSNTSPSVPAPSPVSAGDGSAGVLSPGPGEPYIYAEYPEEDTWLLCSTLQKAVKYVIEGGEIWIGDGLYTTETVEISDSNAKNMTIVGESEAGVIIQADASGPVAGKNVFTVNAPGKDITFQELTIRNGDYGIRSSAGNVSVLHCTLYHNGYDGYPYDGPPTQSNAADIWAGSHTTNGGAIRIQSSTSTEIAHCTVYENARGIRFQDGTNGNIHHNESYGNIESGIYLAASTYNGDSGCSDCNVHDNESYDNMNNGILCIGGINNIVIGNNIYDNWNSGITL